MQNSDYCFSVQPRLIGATGRRCVFWQRQLLMWTCRTLQDALCSTWLPRKATLAVWRCCWLRGPPVSSMTTSSCGLLFMLQVCFLLDCLFVFYMFTQCVILCSNKNRIYLKKKLFTHFLFFFKPAANGHADCLRMMIDYGEEGDLTNVADKFGQ